MSGCVKTLDELNIPNEAHVLSAHRTPDATAKFAREAADRIVMMDDGRIVEEGLPEEFFAAPREERTRQFLSKILA